MSNRKKLTVLDVGPGLTYFPFSIAALGYKVVGIDVDDSITTGYEKINASTLGKKNPVEIVIGDGNKMKFPSESFDAVYCVSVLEHIPSRVRVLREINRVLKPGGLCVLTFDINMNENEVGIGVNEFEKMLNEIGEDFSAIYTNRTVHPLNMIDAYNSPFPLYSGISLYEVGRRLIRRLINKPLPQKYNITTYATTLRKK